MDTSKLHGPVPRPRESRRLYEQVEDDIDRGRGRVEDEQTYEVRRMQEDRDVRLRRLEPRREFEVLQEEVDRRTRLERRGKNRKPAPTPRGESIIVEVAPAPIESTLARFVREQEQLMDAARERYEADLRAAEAARDEAIRAAADSPQAKTLANRRFQQRRAESTRAYQQYRDQILGTE